jgi:hypothetical protein
VADRELGDRPPEHHIKQPALSPVIGEEPDDRDVRPGAGASGLGLFTGRPARCPNVRCSSPMSGGDGDMDRGDVPLCDLLGLAVGSHARSDLSASRRVSTGLVDIP